MFTVEYIVEGSGVWIDESERNMADCVVKFLEFNEEMPFTAVRDDIYDHPEVILDALLAGDAGPVKSYAQYKAEEDAKDQAAIEDVYFHVVERLKTLFPDYEIPADPNPITEADKDALLKVLLDKKAEAGIV